MAVLEGLFEAVPEAVGLAMIITNDYKDNQKYSDLEATESDGTGMAAAFTELGYATVHEHNVTALILASILRKASNIPYPKSCKRIAFVFAGHGHGRNERTTTLIMNDGESIEMDFIVDTLSPCDPNNTIGNKVRMFFIDACRGSGEDEGRLVPRGGDCIEKQRLSTNAVNYLLCYSTLAGFKSYELKENGGGSRGLWLPRVARNLTTCDDSIGDILIKVNEELLTEFQDVKKYPFMMQPVLIQTLNETVFLLREKPQAVGLSVKQTAGTSSDKDQRSNLYRATSLPTNPPSVGQASRPELTAASSQQTPGAQIHTTKQSSSYVFAQSTSLPTGNLSLTPSSHQKCQVEAREGATSLPSRTELVQRKAPLPDDSGYYKKQLNEFMQKKLITDSYTKSWKVEVDPKNQTIFKATVECVLVDNKSTVLGDSIGYYDKKNLAKEMAAKDAVRKIEKKLPRAASASMSSPIATVKSDIPVLMNKQNLNNHFQGELKDSLPIYETVPVGNGFQCSITHKRFGNKTITGNVCCAKREAEDSAASKALKLFNK